MKRNDAFLLGITLFVALNCHSYFGSRDPYATGWGHKPNAHGIGEWIGFPFIAFEICHGPGVSYRCPWINWVGNVVVAIGVSYLFSKHLTSYLPPLWPGQSRVIRYSLRELLGSMTLVCVLLGIAMVSRSWGLLVRNTVCLVGPICLYARFWYWRQMSWVHLMAAGLALTLMTLTIDSLYLHESWGRLWFDWWDIGLIVIRAIVLVFGLLGLLVLLPALYRILRHNEARIARAIVVARTWGTPYYEAEPDDENEHVTEETSLKEP